jgi:putative membrane protein
MTRSEPSLPPPPPRLAPGALGPPPLAPLHPTVALDQPLRTSPRTVALEALALVSLALTISLQVLLGEGVDGLGIWFGVLFVGTRIVGWWFRTYTVTARELILEEGFLQKRHRVVPFSRIQQVELRQQLLARVLGVSLVQVETAGDAGSTAVVLRFLEQRQAESLRDHLLAQQRRVRGLSEAAPTTDPGDVWRAGASTMTTHLVRLRPTQLVGAGLSSSFAVLTAAIALGAIAALAFASLAAGDETLATMAIRAVAQTGVAAVVIALVTVGVTVAHSWDYELQVIGDDLHVRYGLLDRRQHTIPRHRLQHVRTADNPLRRLFGLVEVRLYSAATPGGREGASSHIEIPVLADRFVDDLLERAMGDARWRRPPLSPRPPAARRRALVRRTALTAAVVAIGVAAWWPTGAALVPLAFAGVPWGLVAHHRAGWSIEGSVLAFASGALVHHQELIPRERVQSTRTTATIWQRRVDLHSLRVDVAGGRQLFREAAGLMDLQRSTPPDPARLARPVP